MTIAELKAKFHADVETLTADIERAQRFLAEKQTLLLKTQGALEALALLEAPPEEPSV